MAQGILDQRLNMNGGIASASAVVADAQQTEGVSPPLLFEREAAVDVRDLVRTCRSRSADRSRVCSQHVAESVSTDSLRRAGGSIAPATLRC